jgi:hypothetical protein
MASTISVIGSHSLTSANKARERSDDDDDDKDDDDWESVAEARESEVCFVSGSGGDDNDAAAEADEEYAGADPLTDDCDDNDDDDDENDDEDDDADDDVDDADDKELDAGCRFAATDASADAVFIRSRSFSAARLRAISNSFSRSCQRARSAALASPTDGKKERSEEEMILNNLQIF